MKKMPCIFQRDFSQKSAPITREPHPACAWVFAGEGVATEKMDGTACAVIRGVLHARYDAKRGKAAPTGAIPCDPQPDPETGHHPHWLEVAAQPEYKWHREPPLPAQDGTYELVGPKIGANPYRLERHEFRRHGARVFDDAPRGFDSLKEYLSRLDAEGIVFHHPDGRMAKIRRKDFGLDWPVKP